MNTSIASAQTTKSELPLEIGTGGNINKIVRKALLSCGILSSFLYVCMDIFIAKQFGGYSSVSQTVSELSAIGAPTRSLWIAPSIVYSLLVIAFALGVRQANVRNPRVKLVGNLMFAYGMLCIFWPFAPMHQRGEGVTLTDTIHILLAMVTVLLMVFAIGYGAMALNRWFRIYSIVTLLILFVFGTLTGLDGPRIAENLPTPYAGLWERINIGVFLLWVCILSIALLRNDRKQAP